MVRCIVWILSVPSSPGINDPPAATLPPAVHVGVPPAVLRFYTVRSRVGAVRPAKIPFQSHANFRDVLQAVWKLAS